MDHIDRIAEQWRRERPDVEVDALATVGRLLRLAHRLDDALAGGLAEYDLQPGWFDLLAALRRSGAPYELSPTQLIEATLLSSSGMTKRIDRLEEGALVERRPDPHDRRGTLVRLTRKGRMLVDRALETHVQNEEALLAVLRQSERRQLDGLLRRLLEGLE